MSTNEASTAKQVKAPDDVSSGAVIGYEKKALEIIMAFNGLSNDIDSYLYSVALWGLGRVADKPDPRCFGIEAE